jgi:hypothetical protein
LFASRTPVSSVLRRCRVLDSFFAGAFLFNEANKRKKARVLAEER